MTESRLAPQESNGTVLDCLGQQKGENMVKGKGMPLKDEPPKSKSKDVVLDAVKELTKQIADMTVIVTAMKANHDKWVRAGKF